MTSHLILGSYIEDRSSKTGTPQRADSPSDSNFAAHRGSSLAVAWCSCEHHAYSAGYPVAKMRSEQSCMALAAPVAEGDLNESSNH